MKKLLSAFLSILFYPALSQTTITLQPNAAAGKDAYISDWSVGNYQNTNFGTAPDYDGIAWTASGAYYLSRSLLQFDLSSIPPTATIVSAELSLYNNPTSSQANGQHQSLSGSNDGRLERVTTYWDENTVTWNTQPNTTNLNFVTLPQAISPYQDYLNINVAGLVTDMVNNPTTSYGFMIRLNTEVAYRSLVFASSDHPDPNKHPKLVITYVDSVNCTTIQPGATDGKDAYISNWITGNYQNTNFGSIPDYTAVAWTASAEDYLSRSLIQFDLSGIPSNATIATARLSLYNNPTSSQANGQSQALSGPNDGSLERITSYWDENTVTWNTQPNTTSLNSIYLPPSTTGYQDYLNIDVKPLILDIIGNPTSSYGFMLKLNTEIKYRSLVFSSSDHVDPAKHPKLEICYTVPTGIVSNHSNDMNLAVTPNPLTEDGRITFSLNKKSVVSLFLTDILGHKTEIVHEAEYLQGNYIFEIPSNIASGLYNVVLSTESKTISSKFIRTK